MGDGRGSDDVNRCAHRGTNSNTHVRDPYVLGALVQPVWLCCSRSAVRTFRCTKTAFAYSLAGIKPIPSWLSSPHDCAYKCNSLHCFVLLKQRNLLRLHCLQLTVGNLSETPWVLYLPSCAIALQNCLCAFKCLRWHSLEQ